MAINGCLTLAWLEEDDPSRGFFRVCPAAIIAPETKVYVHKGEYGDEDCLRIVPDKNEMGTFKQRMRTLGRLCLIDLSMHQRENDKIRPNKNFAIGMDKNPYMIYSDVIRGVSDGQVCEICPDGRNALTNIAYIRTGGELSGPYRVNDGEWTQCDGFKQHMQIDECVGVQLEVIDIQGRSATLLIAQPHAPQIPADAEEHAIEEHAAQPAPEKPQQNKCAPDESAKTREEDAVSLAFKRLKEQMGLNPRRGRSLSEVVDEQWRIHKQDELGQTVPPQASSEPVLSPAQRAVNAINEAWEFTGARAPLVEGIAANDELKRRILEVCTCEDAAQHPTDERLVELEAERLRLITEIDCLKHRTREMKAELLREMRNSNEIDVEMLKNSITMLETERDARRGEIDALKETGEKLKDELRKALDEPVTRQLARMIADSRIKEILIPVQPTQAPAESESEPPAPAAAEEPEPIEPDALIDRVSLGLRAHGWQLRRDDVVHMLTALALDRTLILTGFAGSDDMRFAAALAAALKDDELSDCVRINERDVQAVVPPGRRICSVLDHPEGAPLHAAQLDTGFLMPDRSALCLPTNIPEGCAVGEDSWLKLLAGELSENAALRIRTLCARLSEFGARVPHGAICDCARYVAAASARMSGGEDMALDYAFATRLLPAVIACAPDELMRALPGITRGMDMCSRLMHTALPIDK